MARQDAFFETIGGGMIEAWEAAESPQDASLSDAAGRASIEPEPAPEPTATQLQHDGRCLECGRATGLVGRMYCSGACRAKDRAKAERWYNRLPKDEPSNTQDLPF